MAPISAQKRGTPRAAIDRHDALAIELIRALRGRRSCAELSRRAGYRSNIVQRWEAGQCFPTAARYLQLRRRVRGARASDRWIERFFNEVPAWTRGLDTSSPEAVARFVDALRGKTPIVRIAAHCERNRYSVARWLDGSAEPRLPDFLRLVDACSRRLPDLVAALEDPTRIPSVRDAWDRLQRARHAAYELPLSHAVLRALELAALAGSPRAQPRRVARALGVSEAEVRAALGVLEETGQVRRTRRGYVPAQIEAVDTRQDPERARTLKASWTRTALQRLEAGRPGHYGYSLFAVSRADLERLHALHLQYVRAMQDVIASSEPSECVGLFCAQLLDLGA